MPSNRDIRAGGAFVEFSLRRKGLERSLRQVARRIQRFGASIKRIGLRIAALGAALTTPFAFAVKTFASTGDALDKLAKRTGFAVSTLSELDFAARQSGTSLAALQTGIRTMQRNVVDLGRGLATQKDAFGALGLTYDRLKNLSPEKQFELIADRIGAIEDPTERAARAMQVFGRSGQELVPLLSGGAKGIAALRREARELGLTIDKHTTDKAAALTDAISRLKLQARVAAINIGAALAPALIKAGKILAKTGRVVIDFTKRYGKLIAILAAASAGILALGATLTALGVTVGLLGFALAGIVSGVVALASVLAAIAVPAGIALAAIAAVGTALYLLTDIIQTTTRTISTEFAKLAGIARKTTKGIGDAFAGEDIQLAAEIGVNGIKLAWRQGLLSVLENVVSVGQLITRNVLEVAAGTAAGFVNAWATVRTVTSELGAAMARAFFRVVSVAKVAFASIVFGAKSALVATRELLDPSFGKSDAARARARNLADLSAAAKAAEQARQGQVRGVAALEDFTLSSIERERQARLDMVRDTLDAAIKASKTLGTFATIGLQLDLIALRAEQDELVGRAATAAAAIRFRDQVRDFFAGPGGFTPAGGGDFDLSLQQARAASKGVTSSFNIRALQGPKGGGVVEAIREVKADMQELRRHLRSIDEHLVPGVQPGGLAIV